MRDTIFTKKTNPAIRITVKKHPNGQITTIERPTGIHFPFKVGQVLNRNAETWACVNGWLMDGKDTCGEKKELRYPFAQGGGLSTKAEILDEFLKKYPPAFEVWATKHNRVGGGGGDIYEAHSKALRDLWVNGIETEAVDYQYDWQINYYDTELMKTVHPTEAIVKSFTMTEPEINNQLKPFGIQLPKYTEYGKGGKLNNPKRITEADVRDYLNLNNTTRVTIKSGNIPHFKDANYSGYTEIIILPATKESGELKGRLNELIGNANNQKGKLAIFSDAKPNFGGGITWMLQYNFNNFEDGGEFRPHAIEPVNRNWEKLFANPERFMRYDGQFLYPPRIEHRLQPISLDKLDTGEYVGQPKLNGSNTSVTISENKVIAKERHNTFFAIPPKFDFQSLHRGTGFMCIGGEFMNKSKKDDTGQPFRGFCIWDIMAFDGKILIGSTPVERIALINLLYPSTGVAVSIAGIDILFSTATPGIFKVNSFNSNFLKLYEHLIKVDMIEGFVLKRKNGRMEMMTREQNNMGWAVKVRKPTENYSFAYGGGFDVGTRVGFMKGPHKGEKGYIDKINTTYKINTDGHVIKAHVGDIYNAE